MDDWSTLTPNPDDHPWEARLFGALGVKDLKFAHAFCDRFEPGKTRFGPDADAQIQQQEAGPWPMGFLAPDRREGSPPGERQCGECVEDDRRPPT